MKKFNVHIIWNHGFEHDYTIKGGDVGSRADVVQSAKDHLDSITHLKAYKITDEDGNVIHEKQTFSTELSDVKFH